MIIAIDFDGTFTKDPVMWTRFIHDAEQRGHKVIMVTGRSQWSEDMSRLGIHTLLPVFFTSGELKDNHMRQLGYAVDIWIDDMPGTVQECKILNTTNTPNYEL